LTISEYCFIRNEYASGQAELSCHAFAPNIFDLVFSRFGVMFFSDPQAAFANVRRAMKPGGRLALAVFRAASEGLWPHGPLDAVRHLLPPIPTPGPEEPGPFSWADPARVHRILQSAGFREVSLTLVDPAIQLASTGEAAEAADFVHGAWPADARAAGPFGTSTRSGARGP
jgi:SAM-dependent methyltransferase